MRGVEDGKIFEENHIDKNSQSQKIEINRTDSNGHNKFCKNSYLDSKYYMKKEYKNGTVVNTRVDEHKNGRTKLMYVTIIDKKNE